MICSGQAAAVCYVDLAVLEEGAASVASDNALASGISSGSGSLHKDSMTAKPVLQSYLPPQEGCCAQWKLSPVEAEVQLLLQPD